MRMVSEKSASAFRRADFILKDERGNTKAYLAREAMRDYLAGVCPRPPADRFLVHRGKETVVVFGTEEKSELAGVLYILSFMLENATETEKQKARGVTACISHAALSEIVRMDDLRDASMPIAFLVQRAGILDAGLRKLDPLELRIETIY